MQVKNKYLIYGCSSLALLSSCQPKSKKEDTKLPDKPNILYILIDDMGWKDLGCYGSEFHESPNIDGLAAEGMRFTNAYAACPVSSPTRASILTGNHPVTVNITDWIPGRQSNGARPDEKLKSPAISNQLALSQKTIAEKLKQIGYRTIHIGKWHLGDSGFLPEDQGFDINIAGNKYGMPPTYFYPYETDWRAIKGLQEDGEPGEYLTDRLTQEAINFIKENRDTSFFMHLAYYTVHIPLEAKDSLIRKYEEKLKTMEDTTQNNPIYAAMIETLDDNIGDLMNAIEQAGIEDNTLVFFMSDNGGLAVNEWKWESPTSNKPLREGKGYIYEGGIREPMIVKFPGVVDNGQICDAVISSVDFFPTIMEMLEIPYDPVDGKSFLPLITRKERYERGPVFWHYPHYSNQGGKPASAVRLNQYKLIEFHEDMHLELYNLKEDIGEDNNLASQLPQKRDKLHEILKKWKDKKGAKMPVPNPDYVGGEACD